MVNEEPHALQFGSADLSNAGARRTGYHRYVPFVSHVSVTFMFASTPAEAITAPPLAFIVSPKLTSTFSGLVSRL